MPRGDAEEERLNPMRYVKGEAGRLADGNVVDRPRRRAVYARVD